ncbi:hypothetical protein N0V88_003284 [Collariella sp. IMI 366227]|nr:hypothetical protein N0V88_003284 [Collariella sp. IMI 366227]
MRWLLVSLFLALAIPLSEAHKTHLKPSWRRHSPLLSRQNQNPNQDQPQSRFLNERSQSFTVNGTGIPLVDFDLYFWFFPSSNPAAQQNNEIVIYLTGGPGCSSTGELLQQNGPISWAPGTLLPIANEFSWNRLTNVVWIDQPVGAGFSQGTPTATSSEEVAQQFLGFWTNFVDTFALQGFKVYVTGSSYSGMWAPFIASAMLDRNDATYFNVSGMAIWDGLYSKIPLVTDIPAAAFVQEWANALPFNDTFTATIQAIDAQCGFTTYLNQYLTFPPSGRQPSLLPGEDPITGLATRNAPLRRHLPRRAQN